MSLSRRRSFRATRSTDNKRRSKISRIKLRRIDLLEHLENRLLLSTVSDDGGTGTLLIALRPDENLAIISNGSTYQFSSNLAFDNGGVFDLSDFSGFGTQTLTLQASGIARYTTAISITDTTDPIDPAKTSSNSSVTFNDSGLTSSYANNFNVELMNAAAGPITFNGATSFTDSDTVPHASLSASTSNFILIGSDASITSITTESGGITLSANQQALQDPYAIPTSA